MQSWSSMNPTASTSQSVETAKLKLVTLIGEAAMETAMLSLLSGGDASGYTLTSASGFGRHGLRRPGLIDSGNVRVEVLLAAAEARALLEKVVLRFAGQQVIAFMVDAEAVPAEHFVSS
jgi:hypothetical protein